jgi:hypothetical protein
MFLVPSNFVGLVQILFVDKLGREFRRVDEGVHQIFEPMVPLFKRRASKYAVGIEDKYIGNHKFVRTHSFGSEKGVATQTFIHDTRNTTALLCGHPKTHGNSVFVCEDYPT